MKTITIRLPDVEPAMLVEMQKINIAFKDLQGLLISKQFNRSTRKPLLPRIH